MKEALRLQIAEYEVAHGDAILKSRTKEPKELGSFTLELMDFGGSRMRRREIGDFRREAEGA